MPDLNWFDAIILLVVLLGLVIWVVLRRPRKDYGGRR
jgi:hypothetical protein